MYWIVDVTFSSARSHCVRLGDVVEVISRLYPPARRQAGTHHDPPPLLRQPLGALRDGDQVLLQVDELFLFDAAHNDMKSRIKGQIDHR